MGHGLNTHWPLIRLIHQIMATHLSHDPLTHWPSACSGTGATDRQFRVLVEVDVGADGELRFSFNVKPARPPQSRLHRVLDLTPATFKRARKVARQRVVELKAVIAGSK